MKRLQGRIRMRNPSIIADSSFYICFLDDIKKPYYLKHILTHFQICYWKNSKKEIARSQAFKKIESIINTVVDNISADENFDELLKPFFSVKEIEKGEDEVIAIAYVFNILELYFYFILDDESARHFVEINFSELKDRMYGTVGFIKS